MLRKVLQILFAATLVILLVIGYILQAVAVFIPSHDDYVFRIVVIIGFSLYFIIFWGLFLHLGVKRNSRILLTVYVVFWFAGPFFFILEILMPSPMHMVPTWWIIFVLPLAGFGYFWAQIFNHFDSIVFLVSAIMLLLGVLVIRKSKA